MVAHLQRDLFALGARLADPRHKHRPSRRRRRRSATTTSRGSKAWIDPLEAELPPLRHFILAGGAPAGAALHLARTVCRRAERAALLVGDGEVEPVVLVYLNRLSDLLFVMARAANHRAGVPEQIGDRGRRASPPPTTPACALARSHYENFPVASWLRARADPAARRGDLRFRPHGRRLRRRRRLRRARAAAAPRRVAGALHAAAGRRRSPSTPTSAADRRLRGARPHHRARSTFRSPCFEDLLSRVPTGRDRDAATPRGTRCDDYCRRSANPVGPPGAAPVRLPRRRGSTASPTRSALRCSSPTSGRTSPSTGRAAASTCPRRNGARPAPARRSHGPAGDDAARLAERPRRVQRRARARCSTRDGRCSATCAAGSARSCGRRGTADRASSSGSSRADSIRWRRARRSASPTRW